LETQKWINKSRVTLALRDRQFYAVGRKRKLVPSSYLPIMQRDRSLRTSDRPTALRQRPIEQVRLSHATSVAYSSRLMTLIAVIDVIGRCDIRQGVDGVSHGFSLRGRASQQQYDVQV